MNMSEILGEAYGTPAQPQHSEEDTAKTAQLKFFMEQVKEANIDLTKFSDDQIAQLWDKVAEFPPQFMAKKEDKGDDKKPPFPPKKGDKDDDKEKDEKKEAAARAEYAEKRAMAEKVAEADALGRIMARSYADEMGKIAAERSGGQAPTADAEKTANEKRVADLLSKLATGKTAGPVDQTQAFEEKAAGYAVELLKSVQVDEKVAAARINAVFTLGLQSTEKVASKKTYEEGLHVRALEYAEAAGFEVDWTKV